jgi:hypothetical protein
MTESENERLEFKQSFSDWKAIVETVAAFASSEGGTAPADPAHTEERNTGHIDATELLYAKRV